MKNSTNISNVIYNMENILLSPKHTLSTGQMDTLLKALDILYEYKNFHKENLEIRNY